MGIRVFKGPEKDLFATPVAYVAKGQGGALPQIPAVLPLEYPAEDRNRLLLPKNAAGFHKGLEVGN